MYYIEIAKLRDVVERLTETKPGETVCLSGDQVGVLLKYIEELKAGKDALQKRGIRRE